jgi:Acetyltransferase (GNAT) domain
MSCPCGAPWEMRLPDMLDSSDRESNRHPYATLAYARTLAHVGRPLEVPAWQSCVVARDCHEGAVDAMGTYPLACLAPDCDLQQGLDFLRDAGMVSTTLVVDNLSGPPLSHFQSAFPHTRPFKTHYLVDGRAGAYEPSPHHRNEVRRAAKRGVEVRIVPLQAILDGWCALYEELISRHQITGVQSFTRDSFAALSPCAGLSTVAAFIGDELVSCHLWIHHADVVWSHLSATSALGYANGAAYAVCDHSLRHFSGRLINLGGASGVGGGQTDDGLARFKGGFANGRHEAFICGAVLDPGKYEQMCAERGDVSRDYFPAYRTPHPAD